MKITPWKICLCVLMLCVLMVSVVSAASLEERKTELREKTVATLDKLYEIAKAHDAVMAGSVD